MNAQIMEKLSIQKTSYQEKNDIIALIKSVRVFKDEEIIIASELFDDAFKNDNVTDYIFFSCHSEDGKLLGFVCFGATHIAKGTFDMYWLVVSPNYQGKGIGTTLTSFAENYIAEQGGRLIIIETSSTQEYDQARAFYIKKKYSELARIREYYKPGDDLVIYGKYL